VGQACGHRGLHARTTLRESIAHRGHRGHRGREIGGWWPRDVGDTVASGEGRNGPQRMNSAFFNSNNTPLLQYFLNPCSSCNFCNSCNS
jgi:hypothetical protein